MSNYFRNLFLSVFVLLSASYLRASDLAPEIGLSELKSLVEKKEVFLIDANSESSYKSGHIPGAVHFGKHEKSLADVLPKDKSALVVAYCGSSRCTAWEAPAKELKKLGYTNIKHLKPGIKGWKQAKYPTETQS